MSYGPVERRAVSKVNKAIKSGRLVRRPCNECGTTDKVQAHHPRGYDQDHALDIEWLCGPHHRVRHGRAAALPTWRREGIRRYMERTRPNRNPWKPRLVQISDLSSPPRLLQTIGLVWGMLVTDEERAHAVALFERLTSESREASA